MRPITKIILHCSASLEGIDLTGNDILRMHTNPVSLGGRGWKNPGYHYVVRLSGKVEQILGLEHIANGVKGHKAESIHICYVGGIRSVNSEQLTVLRACSRGAFAEQHDHPVKAAPANTMTPAQRLAIRQLLTRLRAQFPHATLHGHREFAAKACPCFDVRTEFPEFF